MADNNPEEWTQQDAIALRTYIQANPKFIRTMQRRRPKIEGETMEARAVTGSDAKGFFDALDVIDALQLDPRPRTDDAGFIS